MTLDWRIGGLALGLVFFLAVLLVKPIGVSTQFVILDGILWNSVDATAVTQTDTGYTSTNAYLAKSDGKYAKAVANPLNYSFVFVLAMLIGGAVSASARGWLCWSVRTSRFRLRLSTRLMSLGGRPCRLSTSQSCKATP